jgi:hypothetical protein
MSGNEFITAVTVIAVGLFLGGLTTYTLKVIWALACEIRRPGSAQEMNERLDEIKADAGATIPWQDRAVLTQVIAVFSCFLIGAAVAYFYIVQGLTTIR